MLELENVQVNYEAVRALKGISLRVEAGEIVCVLGANGAGKSTMLRAISGLVETSGGDIRLEGRPLRGMPPHWIVKRGVVQCPEGRRIFPECTVLENLEMGGYVLPSRNAVRGNIEKVFELFPRLAERRGQPGSTLSGGEQQMLGVARALMSNPRLLLLDEPSLGLAPLIVAQIFEIIRRINREGITILLVEQNAHEALRVSHRGYVLETGTILFSGVAADLLKDSRVIEAYLGV
jgi:branched-chain amino acid transport system ATP-binding protein